MQYSIICVGIFSVAMMLALSHILAHATCIVTWVVLFF